MTHQISIQDKQLNSLIKEYMIKTGRGKSNFFQYVLKDFFKKEKEQQKKI